MRGRVAAAVLSVVALAVLVAACGSKSSATTTPSPSSGNNTLIVFGAGTWSTLAAEMAAFKKPNPGVTVHSQFGASADNGQSRHPAGRARRRARRGGLLADPQADRPRPRQLVHGVRLNAITFAYTSHSKGAAG